MRSEVRVRPLSAADRDAVAQLLDASANSPVVSPSGVHDPAGLPGFVAIEDGTLCGALTYRIGPGEIEVVTLNAVEPRRGVGSALLAAARRLADAQQARLWLITTDDNLVAQRFYESVGMRAVRRHIDFAAAVAAVKPQARLTFRDAIEFSD